MLNDFQRWLADNIADERGWLKEFVGKFNKRKLGKVDEHLDEIPPYFIVYFDDKRTIEEKPPQVAIMPVRAEKETEANIELKPSEIIGVKVQYILGILAARFINQYGSPVGNSAHLHSERFDSKEGVTVEDFNVPTEELSALFTQYKEHPDQPIIPQEYKMGAWWQ